VSNAGDDKLLDEYLSGATPYSARYRRIESEDVPSELDRAVVEQARENLIKGKRPAWQRIGPSLALAATVVLTASIVMRSNLKSFAPISERSEARAPRTVVDEKSDAASDAERVSAAPPQEPIRSGEASQKQTKKSTSTDKIQLASRQSAPAPLQKPEAGAAALPTEIAQAARANYEAKKVEALQPASSFAAAAQTRNVNTAIEQAVIAERSDAPKFAAPESSSSTEVRADTHQRGRAKENAKRTTEERETSVVQGSLVRDAAPVAATAKQDLLRRDPAAWLKFIRELRGADKQAEADAQWKEFVEAYPRYFVSPSDAARPH
jgi:hypothetical protein